MFFVLSKSLDVLIDPFWWVFGLILGGLVALLRGTRTRLGAGLVVAGLSVFLLTSTPAISFRLLSGLERSAVNSMRAGVTYDAVVLLGGAVSPSGSLADDPSWNDNVERLMTTYDLLRTDRARVAIVSGGALDRGLRTEAEYLARQLIAWGIDPARVIVEDKANNTRENATYTRAIVSERKLGALLVVTSAYHVPRAAGCFRAVGLEADFLPVDYRAREPAREPDLLPRAEFFAVSAKVIRERVGSLVYRASGYLK
jgi:uncharacterized SAM-binding protein YcdF (DUF218 family)